MNIFEVLVLVLFGMLFLFCFWILLEIKELKQSAKDENSKDVKVEITWTEEDYREWWDTFEEKADHERSFNFKPMPSHDDDARGAKRPGGQGEN